MDTTHKTYLDSISVQEFNKILNEIPNLQLEEEIVSIDNSFNRVTSKDIKSPINVPHFKKSRMDGFTLHSEDSFGAEEDNLISLKLVETISAGDIPQKKLNDGECSYVATGAAIPENADGVVMVEFTEREGDKVLISKAITPGTHIIEVGHDIKKEQIICEKDTLIDLPTIGILSSCGIDRVPVYKKITVSLLSTGNELVTPKEKHLEIGKIYDINSIVLKQAIENTGVNVKFLGIIRDDFNELKKAVDNALRESNIVILSGGTSKGEGDLAPQVLEAYDNIEIMVHGVRIKPGKPIIFTKLENKIIFILPGFPTSALSCFYVFIEDFLRRMTGFPLKERISKVLEVGERIYSAVGRHEFKAVRIQEVNGKKKIFPIKTGSEAISTLFNADGYIQIDELEGIVEKGDKKKFYTF